jgi:oligopeptide transport system permease protein
VTAYVFQRLLWLGVVLFAVAVITFALMHAVPGGPWDTKDKPVSPTLERQLNAKYGLDQPVWRQFITFTSNAVRGDLGVSFQMQGRPVTEVILQGLEVTAVLGLFAFAFAVVVGVPLGVLAALYRNTAADWLSVAFATAGASVPSFVLGIGLILLFSVSLGWLPVFGWEQTWWLLPDPRYAILPTITLGALPAAYLARVTRASVLDVLEHDYVRTARAKGLRERWVIGKHVLKNAMIPVLTVSGPLVAALITGSFIVETVFGIPGLGKQFVTSVFQRDYGVIMGVTLFYAAVIALANLAVDLAYAAVDPRIRY